MMPKLPAVCLAVLVLVHAPAGAATATPASAVAEQSVSDRIDKLVSPYYKPDVPGATVIVVKDGKTVFRKAYGLADVARKVPMTPETSLRLGSITKQFTAVAILMLAEEGKLAVTDEITRFLPDYPTHGKKITVEHLLTHTSGIVSYTSKPGFKATATEDKTVAQMIDSFKNEPLEFDPGTRYQYNNSGYFLLGAIIEKVSGLPYAKFVEQRIFVPLGMSQTAYEGFERGPSLRAAGHAPTQGGFAPSEPLSMTQPYAAGSLVSTVDDLARWDAAISTGKLLKEASWKRAFTPYRLASGNSNNYAYGWEIDKLQGRPMISHGGSINGFNSFALRLPDDKVYVAVLSNTSSGVVWSDVVAKKAAAIAIGKPYPEFRPMTVDASALDAYAGVYQVEDGAQMIIRRDKDKLVMQRPRRPRTGLTPFSANGFFLQWGLDHLEFSRNANGEVTHVTFYKDGNPSVNPRIGPVLERKVAKISHAVFDARAGRYELSPNFILEVSRDGDQFFAQATGQRKVEIFPESETVFFYKEVDAELRFEQGAGSPVVLKQNGRDIVGRKLQ